jgi:hypothetical protein
VLEHQQLTVITKGLTVAQGEVGIGAIDVSRRRRRQACRRRSGAYWLDSSRMLGMSRVVVTMVTTPRLGEVPTGGDGRSPAR